MSTIIVYSNKKYMAYELAATAHSIGLKVIAVTINDEQLAISLAKLGEKVLAVTMDMFSLADTIAIASVLQQAAEKVKASTLLLSNNRHLRKVAGRLAKKLNVVCLNHGDSLTATNVKLVCTRNDVKGSTLAKCEIEIEESVIALSSKVYIADSMSRGGSIEDFHPKIKSTLELLDTRGKNKLGIDINSSEGLMARGRGSKNHEDFLPGEPLAKALGGMRE